MNLDRRYAIVVLVAILLALGAALWFSQGPAAMPSAPGGADGSQTKSAVPANVTVPDSAAQAPEGIAAPKVVTPAAPGVEAKLRVFDLVFEKNAISPSSLSVRVGDTVHLNLSAKDGAYDFTQPDLGFRLNVPEGGSKVLEFSPAGAGRYSFYCASCGGPAQGPVGYIYVLPKDQ